VELSAGTNVVGREPAEETDLKQAFGWTQVYVCKRGTSNTRTRKKGVDQISLFKMGSANQSHR
jgi:hypothetical protein